MLARKIKLKVAWTNPATIIIPSAEEDDGSCKYKGSIVFWHDEATATYLNDNNSKSLTFYVDNTLVGSSAADVFFTSKPTCGQASTITVEKDLGSNKTKSFSYSVKDDSDNEIWS